MTDSNRDRRLRAEARAKEAKGPSLDRYQRAFAALTPEQQAEVWARVSFAFKAAADVIAAAMPAFVRAMQEAARAVQPLVDAVRQLEQDPDWRGWKRGYELALEVRGREDEFALYGGDFTAAKSDGFYRYHRPDDDPGVTSVLSRS